ncbi:MAG: DUF1080 domain-containing protein [Planctomycetaceae bacterium]
MISAALSMAQRATAQETVVTPTVQPNLKTAETEISPSAALDDKTAEKKVKETETVDLLTDDLTQHWKIFSSAPSIPDAPVWKVIREGVDKELILICSGEPKGFLYTTETCSEFELTLEWKYPKDVDGNSGVLVYMQDEPRIWPTSMQVQLHQPKAGSVFPGGDATSDHSSEAEPDLARPVDTWNEGKIVSQSGRLSVEVNGKKAGEVSGAKPSTGSIALQSEGSVVHFRRIRLRKLPVVAPKKSANAGPGNDTDSTCSDPVISVSPGLPRRSVSERGGRTVLRRNPKVTSTIHRNRRQY